MDRSRDTVGLDMAGDYGGVMTEDEARTKWCPFARVIHFHDNDHQGIAPAAGNRGCHGYPKPEARCIASDCMAWRWGSDVTVGKFKTQRENCHGYCGLAGD